MCNFRIGAFFAALFVCFGLTADTYYWKTNTTTGSGYWVDASYWTDADGNDVTAAPTTRVDTAHIDAVQGQRQRRYVLNLARRGTSVSYEKGGSHPFVELGTVTSTFMNFLNMVTDADGGDCVWPAMTTSVADPNGFPGFWKADSGFGRFVFEATPEKPHSVFAVGTYGYNGITVPEEGTTVSVGALFGQGGLRKEGPGELKVREGSGIHSQIYVKEGTLTLDGLPEDDYEPRIPQGAWLHLDASRADTLETFEQDGRTCIAKWSDCDGGPVYALTNDYVGTATHLIKNSHAPFISEETSGTGLPLVDFGMHFSEAAANGMPSNCWLRMSETCMTAREVFYVARLAGTKDYGFAVLGCDSDNSRGHDFGGGGFFSVWGTVIQDSLRRGETYMNGVPTMWRDVSPTLWGSDMRSLSVVSGSSDQDLRCNTIASDRLYSNYTGAYRIGEILVYTNQLTHDERLLVNRYLMRKWLPNCRADDAGEVVLDTDDAAISVPAGRVARIKSLSTMGGKIVKTGAGTLLVDGISPSGTPLEIRGGSIRIATPAVSADAPAADPYLWLDATATNSLVFADGTEGAATRYITRWNDRRPDHRGEGDVYAEVPPADQPYDSTTGQGSVYADGTAAYKGHLPWVVEAASPTGLEAIDFGIASEKNLTFMWQQPHGVRNAYCGFVVVRGNQADYELFGGTYTHFMRANTKNEALQERFSRSDSRVSYTVDGRPVDPFFPVDSLYDDYRFHVISFSANTKLQCDLLAKYTVNQVNYGGKEKIGEYIIYDRKLTPEERRNTEAYLMAKWLGKPHPESAEGVASGYRFASGADGIIDVSENLTVNALTGASSIVKRGAGAVRVDDVAHATEISSVAVEEGSLTLRLDIPDDAAYRYDASDLDSFVKTYTTDDGNGGLTTNIVRWADQVRGSEAFSAHEGGFSTKYADSTALTGSGSTTTNPVLAYVEMPDGVKRPTVDFHRYLNVATLYNKVNMDPEVGHPDGAYTTKSAGFKLEKINSAATDLLFGESHIIFSDANGSQAMYLFGDWSTHTNYYRGTSGKILGGSANSALLNGRTFIDGERVAPLEGTLSAGFHAVSFQPVNAVRIATLALERNCNSGGCRISECSVYTNQHSEEVCQLIDRRLMRKWFGADRAPWLTAFDSLSAAKGATVTLEAQDAVSVGELAGAGTIAGDDFRDVSAITVTDLVSPLKAEAAVSFADVCTVTLDCDLPKLAAGTYTLFEADAIVAAPTRINVVAVVPRNRQIAVRVDGNAIVMDVTVDGSVLIVR